jgi:regulator of nucleoside diphosphate kinase
MTKQLEQLIIRKEDFEIIKNCLNTGGGFNVQDSQNIMELEAELKRAKLVSKEQFPDNVIGLNTTATIKDMQTNRVLSVTIVTPDKADIKQHKISVLAPIGTALLGFRKGQQVKWQMPSGAKKLVILDVLNGTT